MVKAEKNPICWANSADNLVKLWCLGCFFFSDPGLGLILGLLLWEMLWKKSFIYFRVIPLKNYVFLLLRFEKLHLMFRWWHRSFLQLFVKLSKINSFDLQFASFSPQLHSAFRLWFLRLRSFLSFLLYLLIDATQVPFSLLGLFLNFAPIVLTFWRMNTIHCKECFLIPLFFPNFDVFHIFNCQDWN